MLTKLRNTTLAAFLALATAFSLSIPARAAYKDWSGTAANNATSDATINWAEGQAPSTVNDSARAMMAALASWRDLIDYGTISNCSVGGSGNAITLTCSPTIGVREAGRRYLFAAGAGNTSTVTLTVDSTTAGALQWKASALVSGDIATGDIIVVEDDGTNFQVLTVPRISLFGNVSGLTADGTGATGDYFLTYDVSASLPKKVLFSTYQTLMAASQAQMETGTSTAVDVTPGRVQYHAGVSKAWAAFQPRGTNGASTVDSSYNVSGVARTAAGTYEVSFTNAMSSGAYTCTATSQNTGPTNLLETISALATTKVTVVQISASTAAASDLGVAVHIMCMGDL